MIEIEPVLRLNFEGRDLGIFTEQQLLKLRDEIDKVFGLDKLIGTEGFDVFTVMEAYCVISGATLYGLRGRTKTEPLLFYRQMAMEFVREFSGASQAAIGRAFGGREPSAVHHNAVAVKARIETSAKDRAEFGRLRLALADHLNKQRAEKVIEIKTGPSAPPSAKSS